jgi:hypothetical protein
VNEGNKKSGPLEIATNPAAVDPPLEKFTILGWTSSSRHIETPYDLVYKLRTSDETISEDQAKEEWQGAQKHARPRRLKNGRLNPILVMDGDHDEFVKREHVEYIATTIPGVRLRCLALMSQPLCTKQTRTLWPQDLYSS